MDWSGIGRELVGGIDVITSTTGPVVSDFALRAGHQIRSKESELNGTPNTILTGAKPNAVKELVV